MHWRFSPGLRNDFRKNNICGLLARQRINQNLMDPKYHEDLREYISLVSATLSGRCSMTCMLSIFT